MTFHIYPLGWVILSVIVTSVFWVLYFNGAFDKKRPPVTKGEAACRIASHVLTDEGEACACGYFVKAQAPDPGHWCSKHPWSGYWTSEHGCEVCFKAQTESKGTWLPYCKQCGKQGIHKHYEKNSKTL